MPIPENFLEQIAYLHSLGGEGEIEVEIKMKYLRDLSQEDQRIAQKHLGAMLQDLERRDRQIMPKYREEAEKEKAEFEKIFYDAGLTAIYMEPIPNGYCSQACCSHLPWFIVTTRLGRFKIGWRKRVIHLEWTETDSKAMANELFPEAKDTMGDQMIHCWGEASASERVRKIAEDFYDKRDDHAP